MSRYFDMSVKSERDGKWKKIGYIKEDEDGKLKGKLYTNMLSELEELLSAREGFFQIFPQTKKKGES